MKYKVIKRYVDTSGYIHEVGEIFNQSSCVSTGYSDWLLSEGYIEEIKEESVVFIPKEGQEYWYVSGIAIAECTCYYSIYDDDIRRIAIGNCYKTETDCKFAIEKAKVIRELEVLANFKPDWSDENQEKWVIKCDYYEKKIKYGYNSIMKIQGTIEFRRELDCINAIKQIGEDRILKYLFNIEK